MARRTKITIETGPSLVVVQDYETATGQIYQMKAGGFGEYTMAQYANVDLTNSESMIALIHSDGTTFQAVAIESIESVTINGVAATITDLELVREVLAPYFFSLGGGGEFAFYTEVTLTSAILLNQLGPAPGYMFMPAIAGHYYDFKINWEYTRGTASYSTGTSAISFDMRDGGTPRQCCLINGLNLSYASSRVCPNIRPTIVTTTMNPFPIGSGLYIRLASNLNATLGDGSVLLKIWYNLIAAS